MSQETVFYLSCQLSNFNTICTYLFTWYEKPCASQADGYVFKIAY